MATAVITGGTDGIGRALADTYLGRGHQVLVIGRDREKGQAFVDAAGGRARFLPADLALVGESRRALAWIAETYPRIDVLVLGARFHRSTRAETAEGLESNFALYYLSRFLFSHGLVGPLSRAPHPVVLNFGGAGQTGPVRWDDLQLRRNYPGTGALGHGAKLCDLLGVSFTRIHRDTPIRYVLNHPGVVATSFAGEYDRVAAAQVELLKATGKTAEQAVAQILPYLDDPPARLTAVLEGRRVPTDTGSFDPAEADRLHRITQELLAGLPR
ncbi:SDR family NAD(P)-dependent oxidoreductase [Nonomuraea zeae]|uniref:SDR family NAD(P)-dependent oxidoreductase n=1 Tax=Nonomuraea zeae TaxID=1642303 RepID=A0A5S4GSQ6_9ACTN|nr:SDR family NAD(P)-dependent oxidoreductase [Nonomuraea zeae]TMR35956.1 SDR family NAD(P)-dependent oxidoreductase [Nonomuraea zeae]